MISINSGPPVRLWGICKCPVLSYKRLRQTPVQGQVQLSLEHGHLHSNTNISRRHKMLRLVDLNHVKIFVSIYLEHIYENISPFNNELQFTASCSSSDTDENVIRIRQELSSQHPDTSSLKSIRKKRCQFDSLTECVLWFSRVRHSPSSRRCDT
jgi:hypothetical protein